MQPKQSYSEHPPRFNVVWKVGARWSCANIEAGGGGHKSIYIWAKGECSIIYCQPSGKKKIIYKFFQLHVVFESLLYLWERIPYLTATLDLV